jgi:hypothetical protein
MGALSKLANVTQASDNSADCQRLQLQETGKVNKELCGLSFLSNITSRFDGREVKQK